SRLGGSVKGRKPTLLKPAALIAFSLSCAISAPVLNPLPINKLQSLAAMAAYQCQFLVHTPRRILVPQSTGMNTSYVACRAIKLGQFPNSIPSLENRPPHGEILPRRTSIPPSRTLLEAGHSWTRRSLQQSCPSEKTDRNPASPT